MGKRVGLEGSFAIAEAAKVADVDVISAYPITPQTHVVERLSEMVADGDLAANFVLVESEHSAMSACIGAAAVGARTFTSTSSQGLALMHELLFIASGLRLPVIMAVANRALSAPINIWNDHSDVMANRDTGWIQTFAENAQETYDLILHAFKVGEHSKVSLPVMVNFDGFLVTHTIEALEILTPEEVHEYLPPYVPLIKLDVDDPHTLGPVGIPEIYTEAKKVGEVVLRDSLPILVEEWKNFGDKFGRYYHPIESYRCEDADILFVTMGSIGETAMTVVDELREKGKSVGIARIRLWRPFPFEDFYEAVKNAKVLAVLDRCVSLGGPGGPVASEIKSFLYNQPVKPKVIEFIVGLGGRDVTFDYFRTMFEKTEKVLQGEPIPAFEFIGVRA